MRFSPSRCLLASSIAVLLPATILHAQSLTWDSANASNTWVDDNATLNWLDGITPSAWIDDRLAIFGGIGEAVTISNAGTGGVVTANGLQFDAPSYTISGDPLTLTGAAAVTTNADATISAIIQSTVGLNKTGAGTLVLGGVNTFAGNIGLGGGTLSFSDDNQLGGAGTIAFSNGASLAYTGASATLGATRVLSVGAGASGALNTGANSITLGTTGQLTGAGTLAKTGAGNLILNAANAGFTGTAEVGAGRVVLNAVGNAAGTGTLRLTGGDVELAQNAATTFTNTINVANDARIFLSGTGATAASTNSTVNALTIGTNTLEIAAGTGYAAAVTNGIVFNSATFTGNATFNLNMVNGAGTSVATFLTLNDGGVARALTKTGTRTFQVNNAATSIVAGTTLTGNQGHIRLLNAASFGAGSFILNGSTLEVQNNANTVFGNNVAINASTTITPARSAAGGSVSHTLGTLSLGTVTVTVAHGGNFNADTTGSVVFGATTLAGNPTFTLNNTNGTSVGNTSLGAIDDTGGGRTLTKIGAGQLIFAVAPVSFGAANTININQGTLTASNAVGALGTAAINLGDTSGTNGAVLGIGGAGGTIAGNITVRAGSSGTLQIRGGSVAGFKATYTGSVTLNKAVTLDASVASNMQELSGPITGAFNLTKTGTGVTILSNIGNTFGTGVANSINATAGLIGATSDAALGNPLNGVTLAAATFRAPNSFTTARTITMGVGGGSFDIVPGATLTLSAPLAGTSGMTKQNAGTLATTVASGNPFGTQAVQAAGGTLAFTPGGSGAAVALSGISAFSFGANSRVQLDQGANTSLQVTAASFAPVNAQSAVVLIPGGGFAALGVTEKLIATTNPAVTNGIVNPQILGQTAPNDLTTSHLNYSPANGFIPATYVTGFDSGSAVEIADILAGGATVAANETAYAVRTSGAISIDPAATLTIGNGTGHGSIIVNGGSVSGGTLAFGAAVGLLNVNADTSISSAITGSAGIYRSGAPNTTLTLSGPSTFTGAVFNISGTLVFSADNNLGAAANAVTIGTSANSATLRYTGPTLSTARGFTLGTTTAGQTLDITTAGTVLTLTGVVGGGVGASAEFGGNGLTLNGPGELVLTGINTFGGGIIVNNATLAVNAQGNADPTNLGAGGKVITLNGSIFRTQGSTDGGFDPASTTKSFVIGAGGGTFNVTSTGGTTAAGIGMTLNDVNQLSGSGPLIKRGNQGLLLGQTTFGYPDFTGTIDIAEGLIRAANPLALGATSGGTTVSFGTVTAGVGGTLDVRATIAEPLTINGTGSLAGTPIITGSGALVTNGGTGAVTSAITLGSDSSIGGAGALTISGSIGGAFKLTRLTGGGTTVTNSGTTTLTGNNTYAGGTDVRSGTLILNAPSGNALGTGPVTINTIQTGGVAATPTIATIQLGANEQIGDAIPISLFTAAGNTSQAVFNLAGFTETVGPLTIQTTTTGPAGTVANVISAGVVTGASGTLILNDALTFQNNRGATDGLTNARLVLVTGTGTRITPSTGGTLNLNHAARALSATSSFADLTFPNDGTIDAFVTNGGIVKQGERRIVLTNPGNNFSGTSRLEAGTLQGNAGTAAALTQFGTSTIQFAGGALGLTALPVASNAVITVGNALTLDPAATAARFELTKGVSFETDGEAFVNASTGTLFDLQPLTLSATQALDVFNSSILYQVAGADINVTDATYSARFADLIAPAGLTKMGNGRVIFGFGSADAAAPNFSGLTLAGGTFLLNKAAGVNLSYGAISIAGGTLSLNADEQIADGATVDLSAGQFNFGNGTTPGADETIATLNITGGLGLLNNGNGTLLAPADTTTAAVGTLNISGGSFTLGSSDTELVVGSGGLNITHTGATVMTHNRSNVANAIANKLVLNGNVTFTAGSSIAATPTAIVQNAPTGPTTTPIIDLGGGTRIFNIDDNLFAPEDLNVAVTIDNGSLVKTGPGALAISNTTGNNLAGGVIVNAGTLIARGNASGNVFGTSTVTLNGGTLSARYNGTGSGTVLNNLNSPVVVTADSTIDVRSTGTNVNNTVNLTSLTIGAQELNITGANDYGVSVTGNTALTGSPIFIVGNTGGTNRDLTLSTISEDATPRSISKSGTGTLAISGLAAHTGATNVEAGTLTLLVGGSISGSTQIAVAAGANFDVTALVGGFTVGSAQALTVNGGANGDLIIEGTLRGSGTLTGNIDATGGTIAPGNSPGVLTLGSLVADATTTLSIEIGGTAPVAGVDYDQIRIIGSNLTLDAEGNTAGALLNLQVTTSLAVNDIFTIILNDGLDPDPGLLRNTAGNLANNTILTVGAFEFRLSYFDDASTPTFETSGGNDVSLLVTVPEPGTALSLLASFGVLLGLRRFRHSSIK